MSYKFVPRIGQSIKLKTAAAYAAYQMPPWINLTVLSLSLDNDIVKLGAEGFEQPCYIAPSNIAPPIGWKPVYTFVSSAEDIDKLLSFFTRGLVVRQSQYIGDSSTQFQPADDSAQSHWKFGEVTDIIPAAQTSLRVRLIQRDYQYDAAVERPCKYCNGAGERSAAIGDKFKCPTCNNGRALTHIAGMDKNERKAAIAELAATGWTVGYSRQGAHWYAERETVIRPIRAYVQLQDKIETAYFRTQEQASTWTQSILQSNALDVAAWGNSIVDSPEAEEK